MHESSWNSIHFGNCSELKYSYAIGYVSNHRSSEIRYNKEKLIISSRDSEFYKLKYVEWTQEREDFFCGIQDSFEKISNDLNKFSSNIKEESIDFLIINNSLKLLE